MRHRHILLVLFAVLIVSSNLYSQHLGAYVDYTNNFYVFDKGKSTKIEDQKPKSFKIGAKYVLYLNAAGNLKMYADEKVTLVERGGVSTSNYFATDYLAAYSVFEKLNVIYEDSIITLSKRCPKYKSEDSLIGFYDKNLESLRVFYRGEIQDIETGMIGPPLDNWMTSDNIIAYISSRTKDFKIWYQGEVYEIKRNVSDTKFKAGRNIVAYIDPIDESFKAFYKGEIYDLGDFPPQSFKMGDNFVAFVNDMGEFNIFTEGETQTISTQEPEAYLAEDQSLAFVENGRFMAWFNNETIEVEAWVPTKYKADWNTIAYLDNTNRIWIFQKGERKYLSNEFVNSFDIYRDLIQMNVKVDRNIIYYQDQFYEGESVYK